MEAQRSAAAAQVKIPVAIKPRLVWPKTRIPVVMSYNPEGWFYFCTFYLTSVLTRYFAMQDGGEAMRTMCGSRTGGWSLPCVMSD
jgi:hypothetical protein